MIRAYVERRVGATSRDQLQSGTDLPCILAGTRLRDVPARAFGHCTCTRGNT